MSDSCGCAHRFTIRIGRTTDYNPAKKLLNQGRHPAFIGRSTFDRCARDGGALFVVLDDIDVAVALINAKNSTLLALNIHPQHRSHGLGRALMSYLRPNFARVIDDKVDWFASVGYLAIGEMKQGRRRGTQIMVRAELRELTGRIRQVVGDVCRCTEQTHLAAHRNGPLEHDSVAQEPVPRARFRPGRRRSGDAAQESNQTDDGATVDSVRFSEPETADELIAGGVVG